MPPTRASQGLKPKNFHNEDSPKPQSKENSNSEISFEKNDLQYDDELLFTDQISQEQTK